MAEQLKPRDSAIVRSVEDLSPNDTYESLIKKYGAKAAGLLWVKKHLPHIPQAKMIVAPPGTDSQEIVSVAQEQGLQFPWIVRASTPVDNIAGFENAFSTFGFDLEDHDIANLPSYIDDLKIRGIYKREPALPFTEASVIIAEQSPSKTFGTIIEHPHAPGRLLAGVTAYRWPLDPKALYTIRDGKASLRERWSKFYNKQDIPPRFTKDIEQVAQWYEQIQQLTGFSRDMTYQLEFGLDPLLFFQTRDFLPVSHASYALPINPEDEKNHTYRPFVFGITPEEGIIVTVFNQEDETKAENDRLDPLFELPVYFYRTPDELENTDIGIVTNPFDIARVYFPRKANIFENTLGLLAHDDIRAMRTTDVTVVNARSLSLKTGDKVKIISDGIRAVVEKL